MSALPASPRAYLEVLHRLRERGVSFVLTGSLALRLYMDELDGEPIPDCDLFLDPAPDNLQRWAATLTEEGWTLEVWGEHVSPPLNDGAGHAPRAQARARNTEGPGARGPARALASDSPREMSSRHRYRGSRSNSG